MDKLEQLLSQDEVDGAEVLKVICELMKEYGRIIQNSLNHDDIFLAKITTCELNNYIEQLLNVLEEKSNS